MSKRHTLFAGMLAGILLVITLTACSTGRQFTDLESRLPAIPPGEARIYFYRIDSTIGWSNEPDILLNGEKVGRSVTGEFFYVDVKRGNYEVTCAGSPEKTTTFSLERGEVVYVRTGYDVFKSKVYPKVVRAHWAREEMQELKYPKNLYEKVK